MRRASRRDPLSSLQWCCTYDPALADRRPPRRRYSRVACGALECAGLPLDLACRRLCRFRSAADPLEPQLQCRPHPYKRLVRAGGLELDSPVWHSVPPGDGRPQPSARAADSISGYRIGAGVLDRNYEERRLFSLQSVVDSRWNHRRLPRARSISFLLRLGADAGPDVFSNRHMGTRAPRVCRDEVFSVHPTQRLVDVDRDPRLVLCASPRHGHLYFRVHGTAGHAARSAYGYVDHVGLFYRVCSEASNGPVSYV